MTRKLVVFEVLLIAVAVLATVQLYPYLPARIVTHWGMNGEPNGYSAKDALWLVGPGLLALILALTAVLPWLSPRRFEVDAFRSTYNFIMLAVFLMMAYCYGLILWAGAGRHIDVGRFVIGGTCLFFAVTGNVMSKVRSNFYIGVRTPWTLANQRVWHATHRFAAKCFLIAGLLGFVLALAGVRLVPVIAILAGAFTPAIYSLVYYKQLEKHGEL